jgi:hypothetical protein
MYGRRIGLVVVNLNNINRTLLFRKLYQSVVFPRLSDTRIYNPDFRSVR